MHISDCKKESLKTITGLDLHVNDMYYIALGGTDPKLISLNVLEYEWLGGLGRTEKHLNDRWYGYLKEDLGYAGALQDMLKTFWCNGAPGLGGSVTYLLDAPFTADDQVFTDGQVLDTPAEGITTGSATVYGANQSIVSNELSIAGAGLATEPLRDTAGVSRDIGLLVKSSFQSSATTTTFGPIGVLNTDANSWAAGEAKESVQYSNTLHMRLFSGAFALEVYDFNTVITQAHEYAMVFGGYSSDVPWNGSEAGFTEGVSLFLKLNGGSWILVYRWGRGTTATLYPIVAGYTSGATYTAEYFKVAESDATLKALLSPTVLDTFTDTNGTALASHTPDVGSGWTVQSGSVAIQNNRSASNTTAIATIEAGIADVFAECIVRILNADNSILLRFSDTDNFWACQANESNNEIIIFERNATVWTGRASTSVTINQSTDYTIKATAEGQTITAYLDDANKISYASATLNQTSTIHGIRFGVASNQFDNFAIYPRSGYTDLDNY